MVNYIHLDNYVVQGIIVMCNFPTVIHKASTNLRSTREVQGLGMNLCILNYFTVLCHFPQDIEMLKNMVPYYNSRYTTRHRGGDRCYCRPENIKKLLLL